MIISTHIYRINSMDIILIYNLMYSEDSTDLTGSSSSGDETSDVACLYLSCPSLECDETKCHQFSECLTSDIHSQRLYCPECRQKYRLEVFTKSERFRVLIERESGNHIDSTIRGTLCFPQDWNSFYIDRVH